MATAHNLIDKRTWAREMYPMLEGMSPRRVRALRAAWIAAVTTLGDKWLIKIMELRGPKTTEHLGQRMKKYAKRVQADAKRAERLTTNVRPIKRRA